MNYTNIPVQIASFVMNQKLHKVFATYLSLKFHNDKIKGSEIACFTQADKRTFNKHLETLLELNWIGYNPKSDTYHVRGFDFIRTVNRFKRRRSTRLLKSDLNNIQPYLAAALICNAVIDQQYYKRPGTVTKKRGVTKQSPVFSYLALSNYKIAKILGCKQTRACVLKNKAKKLGYLSTTKKLELYSNEPGIKRAKTYEDPHFASRLIIIQGRVFKQLPDEITPLLIFRKLKKLHLQKSETDSRGS